MSNNTSAFYWLRNGRKLMVDYKFTNMCCYFKRIAQFDIKQIPETSLMYISNVVRVYVMRNQFLYKIHWFLLIVMPEVSSADMILCMVGIDVKMIFPELVGLENNWITVYFANMESSFHF